MVDADNDDDDDSDDDDDDDNGPGLFDDSDDDDDDDEAPPPPKKLSKKERMEALRAKKRSPSDTHKTATQQEDKDYDSGDSYNSAEFVRTKEDNDFIDMDDDDPDAIHELYAEQRFDDERPLDWEDDKKKKKKKGNRKSSENDADGDGEEEEEVNPIMAAVHKMKKKKRAQKKLSDLEEEAKEFLSLMERAADEDDAAIRERRPATRKLAMLHQVLDMLARRDMQRLLLDFELLAICKRWIQPLPNGSLGNVTVRQELLNAISKMNGESGVTPHDLKRSEFGKVVMALYMHKSETPSLKRQHKKLIEQWSRPIFQKSGNMRDLQHVNRAQVGGLTAVATAARASLSSSTAAAAASRGGDSERDLQDIIATGQKSGSKESSNRVRVPFSKGFQYSVQPQARTGDVSDKRMMRASGTNTKDTRSNLSKRMTEKGRAASKNQRSANISIEGRPTK